MLERYPAAPNAELLRFRLADSYRRSAEMMKGAVGAGQPQAAG